MCGGVVERLVVEADLDISAVSVNDYIARRRVRDARLDAVVPRHARVPKDLATLAHAGRGMVTIKDVAREAGVSVATVSRVYNNSDAVRAATRRHVQAVGLRLGYAPNGAARSLITSKTNTIGVLLPDLYGEFFSE